MAFKRDGKVLITSDSPPIPLSLFPKDLSDLTVLVLFEVTVTSDTHLPFDTAEALVAG